MRLKALTIGTFAALLASAGVSAAATSPSGTYTGATNQSQGSVSFKVVKGTITKIAFVDATEVGKGCASIGAAQPQYPVKFKTDIKLAANGNFTATAAPRQDEVFKIHGRYRASALSGWFTDSIPIGQDTGKGFTCKSGKVTFSAPWQ